MLMDGMGQSSKDRRIEKSIWLHFQSVQSCHVLWKEETHAHTHTHSKDSFFFIHSPLFALASQ